MIMLHSVWSGEESANARRKVMTMLAVLALLASVLMWATPQAAAQSSPIVEANAQGVESGADADPDSWVKEATVDAGGTVHLQSASTHEDPDLRDNLTLKWEIDQKGPYSWLQISNADAETASFSVPIQGLIDSRAGDPDQYRLVVTLTVTDTNGESASEEIVIRINRKPDANLVVSLAGKLDKSFEKDVDAKREELFGRSAVIDGPGENGNRNNEWDIRGGSYVVLDASGSSVPGGKVGSYAWEQTFLRPNAQTGFVNGEITTAGATLVVGDGADDDNDQYMFDPDGDTTTLSPLDGDPNTDDIDPFNLVPDPGPGKTIRVNYTVTVTGEGSSLSNTASIRLVIHGNVEDEEPIAVTAEVTQGSLDRGLAAEQGPTVSDLNGNVENQYIVNAGSVVEFTASTAAGITNEKLTWTGATEGAQDSGTASFRVPSTAVAGTTFDVSVTDGDRTTTAQLLVGTNQAPTAGGISASIGSQSIEAPPAVALEPPTTLTIFQVDDGRQKDGQMVTLRGVGNDPDGGAITQAWTLRQFPSAKATTLKNAVEAYVAADADQTPGTALPIAVATELSGLDELDDPTEPLVELIDPLGDGEVSFAVPEVRDNTGFILLYSVVDSARVVAAQTVYIHITAEDDKPVANAGAGQQVASGAFVRLDGSGSADPDPGDSIAGSHSWTYVGANMSPLPDARGALSDAEIGQLDGWVLRQVTTDNPLPDGDTRKTFEDSEGNDYVYIVDAKGDLVASEVPEGGHTGKLMESGSAYPYFTAPKLTGFNNLGLTFHLTVTDGQGTTTGDDPTADDDESDPSPVTITVARVASNEFYSGVITGPGFCTNRSFGGPMLFAHDGDGDGVAETCSLNTTRRATIARQNALEAIAALNPTALDNAIDAECRTLVATNASYDGDEPADLANDACADASNPVAVIPVLSGATAYGPTVKSPAFCSNFSLGGPIMYPYDSDGDGVYDICSLNSTRREAVARQAALAISFEVSFSAGDQTRHDELVELRELQELGDDRTDDQDTRHIDLITKYEGGFTDSTDGALDSDEIIALSAEIDSLAAAKSAAARYANALAAACRALAGQVFEGDKAADLATDECVRPTTSGIALPSGS